MQTYNPKVASRQAVTIEYSHSLVTLVAVHGGVMVYTRDGGVAFLDAEAVRMLPSLLDEAGDEQ